MKEQFFHNFPLERDAVLRLADSAKIVLDTNIIRNLYKYSDQTCDELINKYESLGDRLWIPFQVAEEYTFGRFSEIRDACKPYHDCRVNLQNARDAICKKNAHPFINKELQDRFIPLCLELEKVLKSKESSLDDWIENDRIFERLSQTFRNRIGNKLEVSDSALWQEYRLRCDANLPPGNKDKDNSDLVIWKEIIEFARLNPCDIVLVSNDAGWRDKNQVGKRDFLGPHPLLVKEFFGITSRRFYLLTENEFTGSFDFSSQAKSEVRKISDDDIRKRDLVQAPEHTTSVMNVLRRERNILLHKLSNADSEELREQLNKELEVNAAFIMSYREQLRDSLAEIASAYLK